jgi:predicted enzyme related to lactoylglutathione lyase
MPRVIHFEINVDEPERAVKFYKDVFGWKVDKWEGPIEYWLITTGEKDEPGIDGALTRRMNPSATTINTIEVPSVDDFISKVANAGGKVISPKQAIPGIGYFAYCQDTEGNVFGIMQEDRTASK